MIAFVALLLKARENLTDSDRSTWMSVSSKLRHQILQRFHKVEGDMNMNMCCPWVEVWIAGFKCFSPQWLNHLAGVTSNRSNSKLQEIKVSIHFPAPDVDRLSELMHLSILAVLCSPLLTQLLYFTAALHRKCFDVSREKGKEASRDTVWDIWDTTGKKKWAAFGQ